jgi:hypothetical protein
MDRIAIELPIAAVAAALMAGMVLATGSAIDPPIEPILLSNGKVESTAGSPSGCLEAPITTPSDAGDVGHARLCHDGRDLRLVLRADGLAPGSGYRAWLGYAHQLGPCEDSLCDEIGLPSGRSTGSMQQIIGEVPPTSRTLELDVSLRDVKLVSGAQILLRLLRQGSLAGPDAGAVFNVP